MRHVLANLAVYAIAVLILLGATFFAWIRSSQLVLSDERSVMARYESATEHEFQWPVLGRDSYRRNCANCHGRHGEGWDQYPGLAQAGVFASETAGRTYLINLHLYGLDGPRWRVPMPRMGHLADAELAAVLNYMLAEFGGADVGGATIPLFLPSEVAARRGAGLGPQEVGAQR